MAATEGERLFPLYLIADVDTARRGDIDLVDVVAQFVRAGGRMISLRPGGADDRRLLELGTALASQLAGTAGTFLVHRRVDLAVLLDADGVHLPSNGIRPHQVVHLMNSRKVVIGRSCHSREEVVRCDDGQWSFATLGPLFESVSKPGYGPGIDSDEFSGVADAVEVAVYALGGVVPDNVARCLQAGAFGVAVVGGILGAESPFEATRRYLDAIDAQREASSG